MTKKQKDKLIQAWTTLNMLCAYYEDINNNTNYFTEKFSPQKEIENVYKLINSIVSEIE